MTLVKREVDSAEIITEFNTKLQTFIIANTAWVGSTPVWNTNVGAVTGESNASKDPGAPVASALKPDISAITSQTNSLHNVITTWMTVYSKTSRIQLHNVGNLAPANYVGTYRFTSPARQVAAVVTGTATRLSTFNVVSGREVKRTDVQSLIDSLQALWTTSGRDTTTFVFNYNYCHSSCHSSRSRR
jgi:hypothetical protein